MKRGAADLLTKPFDQTELVLRVLGEHTFKRFIEVKRQEWEEYRVQVTPWEIDRFLPVL